MKTQILTGSNSEIAEKVARIVGRIREAIVFVEETANSTLEQSAVDIFAEMDEFTVKTGGADYSRQSLYTRMEVE